MAGFTLIDTSASSEAGDGARLHAVDAELRGDAVRLAASEIERALGWRLQPEGLCRGDVCVPVRDRAALVRDGSIDLAAFANVLGRPLALDVDEEIAVLGEAATDRRAMLASLEAPDFALPDLASRMHSLSDHRGKKVLLIAYASW